MSTDDLSDELLSKFRDLIYRRTGIRIPENKRVLISNRLRRRLRATGIGTFADYYASISALGADRDEAEHFIDAVTTRETYFFRDQHQYDWFAKEYLPEVQDEAIRGRRPRKLAIWSSACSTGEEPYSILMLAGSHHPSFAAWEFELLGTDISAAALKTARSAAYSERSLRAVEEADRKRWFEHDPAADRWTVLPKFRSRATFRRHSLLDPVGGGPFDCIFLKNVLIYFDAASKKVAVGYVLDALAPGGVLVLGPTEGAHPLLGELERVEGWLYRKRGG